MEIGFIDLFCGAGGFSRGFYEAGFKPLLGIDIDESCVYSYKENFSDAMVIKDDIRNIHSKDIIYLVGRPQIILASPPCEAFTGVSQRIMQDPLDRLYTDPIGRLTLEAIRIIGDLKPKIFIIENVPGINNPIIIDNIRKEFSRYDIKSIFINILKAEKYGVPSLRRRVFISNILIKPEYIKKRINVWEAIGDLPDPRYPNNIPNHIYIPIPHRFEKRIAGLRWDDGLEHFLGGNKKVYKQYIRLNPRKIAPTIMGRSRFIHPYDDRLLSVREQARLMSYPDNHIFLGGKDQQYNQVGESVPPKLAYSIAKFILYNFFT